MSQTTPKTVMPIIIVESVNAIRNFYVETLGFDHLRGILGEDGQLDFCTVAKDGARIRFTRPSEKSLDATVVTKQPVEIYLEVADVDRYFTQLSEKAEVKVTEPLVTQWWGDRTFKVMDPWGYEIWFYQTVGTPKPPEGTKIV